MMKYPADQEWRDIPGYDGIYQINRDGDVRTWRWRKDHRMKTPRLLQPYMRHGGAVSRKRVVKLTDHAGNAKECSVLQIMAHVWLGGVPAGKVPYHKNGDLADHCVNNIGFMTRQELGRKTGASGKRIPVNKLDPAGEIVAVYPSARTAAKANHMSYQAVLDRCNGKVKNPFALDGHNYQFDL
jgi:hypothetical protein